MYFKTCSTNGVVQSMYFEIVRLGRLDQHEPIFKLGTKFLKKENFNINVYPPARTRHNRYTHAFELTEIVFVFFELFSNCESQNPSWQHVHYIARLLWLFFRHLMFCERTTPLKSSQIMSQSAENISFAQST